MRLVFILVPIVLVAALIGFVVWKISGLKQRLVDDLQTELHARAQVASLALDLRAGELHAAGITLENEEPEAPWTTAEIAQASIHFQLGDLLGSTLPVQVKVTGWKIEARTSMSNAPSSPGSGAPSVATSGPQGTGDAAFRSPGKARVQVTALAAAEGEATVHLENGQIAAIHGVEFHADRPGGTSWSTQLQIASMTAGTLQTGAGSVQLHSDSDKVNFNDLVLHCSPGQITGSGDFGLAEPHPIHASFTATTVPMTMLLATRWQVKLSGLVNGGVAYQGDDTAATATGKLSVDNGRFNLFPWLGKATLLVGLPDVTGTAVDKATTDFSWQNHVLTLQNIDVRKTEVFRVSGQASVAADGTCDGHLRLGLPTAAVARWPKLQTDVFTSAQEDFSWADVHVTGTPENLTEDLSPRLLAVGEAQGGQLLQQTTQKATDLLNSLLK